MGVCMRGRQDPLERLAQGNHRYVAERLEHPRRGSARRRRLAGGQRPFAVILGCSDSRVPPAVVFDQGLGDLFEVRVAGNVASRAALASIEYAVDQLGARLVMVLGHSCCGAVTAALEGGRAPGSIGSLLKLIQPVLTSAKVKPGDPVANAVEENVRRQVRQVSRSPVVAPLLKKGRVEVAGAIYDLQTGEVQMLK
jgi:carbonic anhydrase